MNSYEKVIEIFPWCDTFSVGIDSVDEQHKFLIGLINRLVTHVAHQSSQSVIDSLLGDLISYTEFHFEAEEELWREYFLNDPWFVWHHKAHDDFAAQAKKMVKHCYETPQDISFDNIVKYLTHWLAHHILESDKRMAKVVLMISEGISLEQAKIISSDEMSGATRVLIDAVMSMYDKLANSTVSLSREIHLRGIAEKELDEYREDIINISQAKSRFMAHLSHEIKAPLMAVSTIAELLKSNNNTEFITRAVDTIDSSVSHLRALAQDILDLSMIESEKLALKYMVFNINELVLEVVSMFKFAADNKRLTLVYPNPLTPSVFLGDRLRIKQILINYLSNCIKFTRVGSVVIDMNFNSTTNILYVEFKDTGSGIPEDMISRLFNPFEQTKTSAAVDGCGLGLAISKGLAEMMGGAVGAKLNPGGGSTFWFTVKLDHVD